MKWVMKSVREWPIRWSRKWAIIGRYIRLGFLAVALTSIFQLEIPAGIASGMQASKYLSLEADVSSKELHLGDVLNTELTIRNRSASIVSFTYMKPWIVQPVILKDSLKGNEGVNLTISQYNLAVVPEKQTLKPGETFSCEAMKVVVYDGNLDYKTASNRPVGFWLAAPGLYKVRFSVDLASNDLKHLSGVVTAKDVLIEVKAPRP